MATDLTTPLGLAVSGNTLYVSEGTDPGRVVSVPTTGGTPTVVATGLTYPYGMALSGSTLYIAENSPGAVISIPTTGGTRTTVVTGLNRPYGIAVQPTDDQPEPGQCWGSVCLPPLGS
ncbi:hypothetical protein ACFYSW_27710 [Rhodococcus aetherivorans]|uniref:hypothetical protein n=1 Tax=Rhodococcus aetherivorans TaxID=191292 RepID=UPI0036A55422